MSPLLTIPVPPAENIPMDRSTILCASLRHRVAVHHTESTHKTHLGLWRFGKGNPEWVDIISGCRVVGGLSPSGSWLVVLHEVNNTIHVRIWDVRNGELQVHRQITTAHPHTHPLGVEFKSEERFYSQHDTYRILYVIFSLKPAASSDPDATLQLDTSSDISLESDASVESDDPVESDASVGSLKLHRKRLGITRSKVTRLKIPSGLAIRFKKLAPSRQLEKYYNLDDTREWVTCPTRRICWIPPGCIGSGNGSHCWARNVLVMAGHDGVLRKLIFREPLEGQEMGVQADFG